MGFDNLPRPFYEITVRFVGQNIRIGLYLMPLFAPLQGYFPVIFVQTVCAWTLAFRTATSNGLAI